MISRKKSLLIILLLGLFTLPALAGKTRIAVVEFEAKVPKARRELGTAMADLLIDALVKDGKYSVLERSVLDKVRREQNLAVSGAVDAATGTQIGRLIGAEYLVVGAVTKFEEKGGGGIGGLLSKKVAGGVGMKTSELGITVRIINSTTGEIIISEKISKKERAVGVAAGTSIGGLPIGGVLYKSKAMQTAVDKAIVDAVKVISKKVPASGSPLNLIDVIVTDVSFSLLKKLTKTIKALEGVDNVERKFSKKVATFSVRYEGAADELAEAIDEASPAGVTLEVTGFSDRKVEMAVK